MNPMRKKISFLILISFLSIQCGYFRRLTESIPEGVGILTGYVFNQQGIPLYQAEICWQDRKVLTNRAGKYILRNITTGRQEIKVKAEGYLYQIHILLIPTKKIRRDFVLEKGTLITKQNCVIAEDTTWKKSLSPYVIEESVEILPEKCLVIESGTVMKFKENCRFLIKGRVEVMEGEKPALFTAFNKNHRWAGIEFDQSITGTRNSITFSQIEYAYNGVKIKEVRGKVKIIQNKIKNCIYGVNIENASDVLILYNHLEFNARAGIRMEGIEQFEIKHNIIRHNGKLGFYLKNCQEGGHIIFNDFHNDFKSPQKQKHGLKIDSLSSFLEGLVIKSNNFTGHLKYAVFYGPGESENYLYYREEGPIEVERCFICQYDGNGDLNIVASQQNPQCSPGVYVRDFPQTRVETGAGSQWGEE